MHYDNKTLLKLTERFEKHLEEECKKEFTDTELDDLRGMLKAWRGWLALGSVAKWIIIVLGLVSAGVASITSVLGWFK